MGMLDVSLATACPTAIAARQDARKAVVVARLSPMAPARSRRHRSIASDVLLDDRLCRVALGALEPRVAHLNGDIAIFGKPPDTVRQRDRVVGVDEMTCHPLFAKIGKAPQSRADDRKTRKHRLERGNPEGLEVARHAKDLSVSIEGDLVFPV